MAVGLYQAYVAECHFCTLQKIIYTRYQAEARRMLTRLGWGTSEGVLYCNACIKLARQQARAAKRTSN